jgi:hypothetical protein
MSDPVHEVKCCRCSLPPTAAAAGPEIDLLLTPPDQNPWTIEIERSLSPKLEKGFHISCEYLQPLKRIVIS